jgi:carboxyl-terminal processing protease
LGGASFGKGTVQVMAPLMRGQLKFTESKFYRVSGDSTQHRGVIPDITFPSYYNHDDIGESSQQHALPWDSIHSVNHKVYGQLDPLLLELKLRHDSRVLNEPDWQFMLDEIALIKQQQQDKKLSLNRDERTKLQKERESSVLEIENKRRQAHSLTPFSTFSAFEEYSEELPEDTERPDPSLQEASKLLLDFIDLSARHSAPRVVSDDSSVSTNRF